MCPSGRGLRVQQAGSRRRRDECTPEPTLWPLFILLYADDIILGFTGKGVGAIFDAETAIYALSFFGYHSGLKVNPSQSFVLYKSTLLATPTSVAGLEVKKI